MARKKKSAKPLMIEQAQVIAAEIARKFQVLECAECAIAVAKRLGKNLDACFERLHTADETDGIGMLEQGILASVNKLSSAEDFSWNRLCNGCLAP